MISTKASAVSGPTPGCVLNRCASGHFSTSCSIACVSSAIVGFSRSSNSSRSRRRRFAHGASANDSSCFRPASRHNPFLRRSPSFSATACSWFMIRVRACTIRCRCHSSCRRSRCSQLGTQICRKRSSSNNLRISCASWRSVVKEVPLAGPKLFVSYSWTSPDHEAWVLQLATELRESGVDVILDKWYLREGHDAHAFMEKMVTDPEIRKVILVCDKAYVDKADGRSGGVGTEAQIISGEIYAKQAQDKFVAIVTERDGAGRAYLPAYYRSRIYIDLSDASKYSENFDRLLRWAYDQPLYHKPEIGNKPSFLAEETASAVLATSSRFKRAVDSVRNLSL